MGLPTNLSCGLRTRPTIPRTRLLTAGLASALAFTLLTFTSAALARQTHRQVAPSTLPSGGLERACSLAVDPVSGDIYALQRSTSNVKEAVALYRFNPAGASASFSKSAAYISGNRITGTPTEGLQNSCEGTAQIAIAPAGADGGIEGDIFLATGPRLTPSGESLPGVVDIFASSGEYLGKIDGLPGDPFTLTATSGGAAGLAIGSDGVIYLSEARNGNIDKFVPSTNPPTDSDFNSRIVAGSTAQCGFHLAVSSDSVFAALCGNEGVTRYPLGLFPGGGGEAAAIGTPVEIEGVPAQAESLAVDPGTDDLYLANGNQGPEEHPYVTGIAQLDSTGALVSNFGIPTGAEIQEGSDAFPGIALDPSGSSEGADRLYVSHGHGPAPATIDVWGPQITLPDVTTGPSTEVSDEGATLNGIVNPDGQTLTACHFEYGATSAYGTVAACNLEPGEIGAGHSDVNVTAGISDLNGGARYHYRLSAANECEGAGEQCVSSGDDGTFTTLGPGVSEVGLSEITDICATLSGTVEPRGAATTYFFEVVSEADFVAGGWADAIHQPLAGASVGAGAAPVPVAEEVCGLIPRTTYHIRLVASSAQGTDQGPGRTFTTFGSQSVGLPDGRVYEQATPVQKNGNNAQGSWESQSMRVSVDGDRVTWFANGGVPGAVGAQELPVYLSAREGETWTTHGLLAPAAFGPRALVSGLDEELRIDFTEARTEEEGPDMDLLAIGTAGSHEVATVIEGEHYEQTTYGATSADGQLTIIESQGELNGEGLPLGKGRNVWLWNKQGESFRLVSVLNSGKSPSKGAFFGARAWSPRDLTASGGVQEGAYPNHAFSANGSRLYMTTVGEGQILLRVNPAAEQSAVGLAGVCTEPEMACTIDASRSRRTQPDPNGKFPVAFFEATPEGGVALFGSHEKLTNDATTGPNDKGFDLYRYDAASDELTDLVPDPGDENGAEVQGVLGTSADGSYVYFAANGALADGASVGGCSISSGSGVCNLYVWHAGAIAFITKIGLSGGTGDSYNWVPADRDFSAIHPGKSARVSPNGHVLVFISSRGLTDPRDEGIDEFYRFEFGTPGVVCMTCSGTGEAPEGGASLQTITSGSLAPFLPPYLTRNLSASGDEFFFQSAARLSPNDHNHVLDVYEWEKSGAGSCPPSESVGGCIDLISTGTSPNPSFLLDADQSGSAVFFYTSQPLVGQDKDELVDIYAARIGGGIASQNPPPPATVCQGSGCRQASTTAAAAQTPGSSSFVGAGNSKTVQCKKGLVRRHGKCVKMKSKHKKSKHKKSKHKKNGAGK
jgi:hypothetical protein